MDQDQRMQCLRMAIELGGHTEPIVSAAQQLLDFVHGKERQEIRTSAEPVLDGGTCCRASIGACGDSRCRGAIGSTGRNYRTHRGRCHCRLRDGVGDAQGR